MSSSAEVPEKKLLFHWKRWRFKAENEILQFSMIK